MLGSSLTAWFNLHVDFGQHLHASTTLEMPLLAWLARPRPRCGPFSAPPQKCGSLVVRCGEPVVYEFLEETVANNMIRRVRTVAPETTVRDLYRLFATDRFDAYPVVQDNALVGVVSKLDALKVFAFT